MRVIIDGNAMGWAYHSGAQLSYGGMQTQAIFGFAKMVRDFKLAYPEATCIVLWDGSAKQRFELLPTYKESREATRAADPEAVANHVAYKAATEVIRVMLELMGITQMYHPHYEADDLAGMLCAKFPGPKVLVTGDSDWLQLVNQDTVWFDPRKDGKKINVSNFHEATGYATPDEYLHGKVLIGDTTDDIPGIPGMGKVGAAKFIAQWRSIHNFLGKVDAGQAEPTRRKGKGSKTPHPEEIIVSDEGRGIVERNFLLMDLRNPEIDDPELLRVRRAALDLGKLQTLFQRLGFVSITREWATWATPFQALQPA